MHQFANPFLAMGNNPVNSIDPSGMTKINVDGRPVSSGHESNHIFDDFKASWENDIFADINEFDDWCNSERSRKSESNSPVLIDGTYYHNGFVVSYEYVIQWEKEQGNLINIYNRSDEIPNVGIYANWDNYSQGNSEGQFIAGDPTKFVVPPRPKFLQAPKSEQSCYQDPFATLINNIADGNFILALEQLTEGGPSSLIATVPLIGFAEQEMFVYRAISAAELNNIQATGKFLLQEEALNEKYFARSYEEAVWYGDQLYPNGYSIIVGRVNVPIDAFWHQYIDIGAYAIPKNILPLITPYY